MPAVYIGIHTPTAPEMMRLTISCVMSKDTLLRMSLKVTKFLYATSLAKHKQSWELLIDATITKRDSSD